jgi:hypothetical protein
MFLKGFEIHRPMTKIHTRAKRLLGILSTHRKHKYFFTNVVAKKGAKSFTDKAKAEAWAKENKLDTKKYELYELQQGKKFQWRPLLRD